MKISKIIERVNRLLAGEILPYNRLLPHLDEVIDDINSQLDSKFPAFSELQEGSVEYNYFPDKYIRSVVVKGAAFKFYCMDEEGALVAQEYGYEYKDALFIMLRDYLTSVPEEYKLNTDGGVDIEDKYELPVTFSGWF